ALRITYIISASGRLVAGLLFTKISEQRMYTSTVKRELINVVASDIERTRYVVHRIDELGEKADSSLREDMDRL
ncbi:MAG: hypothetical protein QXF26_04390, partial [Candidatus Bathyarchaeia archaeon]